MGFTFSRASLCSIAVCFQDMMKRDPDQFLQFLRSWKGMPDCLPHGCSFIRNLSTVPDFYRLKISAMISWAGELFAIISLEVDYAYTM